ncbi:MAG: lysophospholipid acyltransferase family protein [Nitriliruptorales bacterium]|nr:lysophospholipid acyltransferase family protein [Nitriliruptorales bacterium]
MTLDADGIPRASWVYRFAAWLAFTIMDVQAWRLDFAGLRHVPTRGGAVIAANHTSFWDFFAIGRGPYRAYGRPIRILAKESLFRAPVFGWLMRRAEHIPVHRGAGRDAFESAVAALQRGELVLVLPEQTISPSFDLIDFKSGAARLAAEAGVPLIPAASWGTHRFHTVGRRPTWSWRLPVTVRYGAPLHPSREEDPVLVTRRLREEVRALLDRAIADYPDAPTAGAWWVPARLGGGAPTVEEATEHVHRRFGKGRRTA